MRFGMTANGSTGDFMRTHGQSPSVLKTAPQVAP
jgi:hypothetical protein